VSKQYNRQPGGQDPYTRIDPDTMPEPYVDGDADAVAAPGGQSFASPGTPAATGAEDPSGENAEPLPGPADTGKGPSDEDPVDAPATADNTGTHADDDAAD
jgi:hypothetical protein